MVTRLRGVLLAIVNTVNYGCPMTQTAQQYEVRGKDRLFDQWTTFTGTYDQCEIWADQRAWTVRGEDLAPLITPTPEEAAMQIETMTIDGEDIPVIHSENFLVDFGPLTGEQARKTWVEHFRAVLMAIGARDLGGLPVPVEIVASGRTGRTVLRIYAPDPVGVVFAAEQSMQDGPKVVVL